MLNTTLGPPVGLLSGEDYAVQNAKMQAQTMRQYFDECESNTRQSLVRIQEAREVADRLGIMDARKQEINKTLYFDSPF